MYGANPGGRRRAAAAAATLAIHAGLAAVLIWGLAPRGGGPARPDKGLLTIELSEPPPPAAPQPAPSRAAAKAAPARQAAKAKAKAAAREARAVTLPFPVVKVPAVPGNGAAAGNGAGSQGIGAGAGGAGVGAGGGGDGGLGAPAARIAGALRDSDYPREAAAQNLAGTVAIDFRVRKDGGIDRCRVIGSSGSALLDELTCRLFTQRFRFRPATDASGRAIDSTLSTSFTWGTRRRH